MKEISEMTAEELRLEIARAKGCFGFYYRVIFYGATPFLRGKIMAGLMKVDVEIPKYTDDLLAAWELLDEMRKDVNCAIYCENHRFVVVIHNGNSSEDLQDNCDIIEICKEAETAPLAICQAWLEWHGPAEYNEQK